MEPQTVKGIGGGAVTGFGKFQPYPFAYDFRQFVLVRQFSFEQVQNGLRGQFAVGVVFDPLGAG